MIADVGRIQFKGTESGEIMGAVGFGLA